MAKRNGGGSGGLIGLIILIGVGFMAWTMMKDSMGGNGGGTIPAGDIFSDISDQDLFGDLLYL